MNQPRTAIPLHLNSSARSRKYFFSFHDLVLPFNIEPKIVIIETNVNKSNEKMRKINLLNEVVGQNLVNLGNEHRAETLPIAVDVALPHLLSSILSFGCHPILTLAAGRESPGRRKGTGLRLTSVQRDKAEPRAKHYNLSIIIG